MLIRHSGSASSKKGKTRTSGELDADGTATGGM